MGTYTTNYQLYTPTVGETGWGTLVNGNFTTIDTTMKSLSNRITAVENEVNGALSCTSVTTSGKITGNGGITGTTGTFSGAVTGASFNGIFLKSGLRTVRPSSTFINMPRHHTNYESGTLAILPYIPNVTYSGSLIFKNFNSNTYGYYAYQTDLTDDVESDTIPANNTVTITFANISYLVCNTSGSQARISVSVPVIT